MLPAIAGIGLAMTGVGAPMAAMMVGGGTALATGSLRKGLMAGLGAFGGAGIGEGLAGMGSAAAASSATAAAAPSAATTAAAFPTAAGSQAAASGMGEAAMGGLDGIAGDLGTGFASQATSPAYVNSLDAVSDAVASGAAPAQTVAMPTAGDFARYDRAITPDVVNMSQADRMKAGLGAIGQPGSFDNFITSQGGTSKAMMNGMLAFGPVLTQQPGVHGAPEDKSMVRPYDYDPRTQRYTARTPVRSRDFQHFAAGGQPDAFAPTLGETIQAPIMTTPGTIGGSMAHPMGQPAGPAQGKPDPVSMFNRYTYNPTNQTFTLVPLPEPEPEPLAPQMTGPDVFAGYYADIFGAAGNGDGGSGVGGDGGGPGAAGGDGGDGGGDGGFADGGLAGLLRGPGDGVSDSIPATINGRQPAAIADGEYIVPARVVSELGNGSSDAGARRLDEMVARVQRARSKTTSSRKAVAADSGAHRMMPA